MTAARLQTLDIEYDAFGSPDKPALLLIMGLGVQMIGWDSGFCQNLADRGLYVIRFDNRDIGLSSKMGEDNAAEVADIVRKAIKGEAVVPPYTLEDMADDAAGLLEFLGIEKAYVCGASMGSGIAQILAARRPGLTAGLTLIYGSSGNPELPPPTPPALQYLVSPQPQERTANIEYGLGLYRAVSGRGHPFEEEWYRDFLTRSYDRCFFPLGVFRQLAAVLTQEDRRADLKTITAPTLVIHGQDDPLVPVECGRDTAASIPGAELMVVPGMGHDLPHGRGPWPDILEGMVSRIR